MPRRQPRPAKRGNQLAARNGTTGQPSKLTDNTEDLILGAVLAGNHLTTACAAAGISNRTLYRWLEIADTVETAIEEGRPHEDSALRYLEFRQRLADARAQAEMKAVAVVHEQMRGGHVIREEPLQDVEGNPVYDNDGNLLVKREYAQPDGRLALAYLARSRPDQWGQKATEARVEVNMGAAGGSDVGGVAGAASGDQIASLSARLFAVSQQRRQDEEDGYGESAVEETGGEVVDGEIVEDEHGPIV